MSEQASDTPSVYPRRRGLLGHPTDIEADRILGRWVDCLPEGMTEWIELDNITPMLEEAGRGAPKADYVRGIAEHHIRDGVHHVLWSEPETLRARLEATRDWGHVARRTGAPELADYCERLASYAGGRPMKTELEVMQAVHDLRRCHPGPTDTPAVRREGKLWVAEIGRTNRDEAELCVDAASGRVWGR